MELRRFMNSIKKMLWLIIVLGAVGGGIPRYNDYINSVPIYKAETTIYAISKGSTPAGIDSINYQDVMLSRYLIHDYQEIITSEKVLTLAMKQLEKYQFTEDQLRGMISVAPKNESSVIGVTATSYEPHLAVDISTAVTQAFITILRELTNGNIVGVINEAKEPLYPIPANNTKSIIIGAFTGIIAALAIIYIRDLFDTTIRFKEDVEYNMDTKVIGMIPKYGIR